MLAIVVPFYLAPSPTIIIIILSVCIIRTYGNFGTKSNKPERKSKRVNEHQPKGVTRLMAPIIDDDERKRTANSNSHAISATRGPASGEPQGS
jgi:hypothetical protein